LLTETGGAGSAPPAGRYPPVQSWALELDARLDRKSAAGAPAADAWSVDLGERPPPPAFQAEVHRILVLPAGRCKWTRTSRSILQTGVLRGPVGGRSGYPDSVESLLLHRGYVRALEMDGPGIGEDPSKDRFGCRRPVSERAVRPHVVTDPAP